VRSRCDEVGECWLWNQGVQSKGYPQASIEGKTGQSVRAYVYTHLMGKRGPMSRRNCIATRCGSLLCVSPACLVLRSRADVLRKQWAEGERKSTLTADFINRKLTDEQVQDIRSQPHGFNQSEWARRNGVHPRTVSNVVIGKNYRMRPAASVFEWRP
jgi:hypothetical protein